MPENDFILTEQERRERRRKRRRWWLLALAFLLATIVAVVGVKPARNAIKSWQARRHADRAFALIEQANWREARDEATSAYQLAPDEPKAVRAVARLLSRVGQPNVFEFWKKLASIQPLTRVDLRDKATVALKVNDLTTADATVQELLSDDKEKPSAADWLLAADVYGRKRKYRQAGEFAEKALAEPGLSRREEYQALFILQTLMRDGAGGHVHNRAEVDERMAALARGNDDVALDALIVLSQYVAAAPPDSKVSTPIPAEELIQRIYDHPQARISHKLLAADLEIRREDDRRIWVEEREIARGKNSGDQDLALLAAWLCRHGECQRALDVLPIERAMQSRELFVQHLDILGALGRWEDLKKLLESERFPLEPVAQRMYLARCNAQLGEKTAADNNWKRALEAARGDTGKLLALADYAEKNGNVEVAGLAFEDAAATAPNLWIAQQGRLRIAQHNGDTKRMQAILAEMLRLRPDDAAVQNEAAYTQLLLLPQETKPDADELKTIEAVAQKLIRDEPESLPHRTVLGLVLLKQNRPQEALRVYDGLNVTQKQLTPSTVVVHAAILALNGRAADARIEISHLPQNKILPEERALISQL